jgi:hypothetical protein
MSADAWISVADALPAEVGIYLVHAPGGYGTSYAVGRWSPERGWLPHLPEVWARAVTHWRPLPEPPKPCRRSATSMMY